MVSIFAILGPVIAAIAVDLHAFEVARKANRKAKFDWELFNIRWLRGLAVGVSSAMLLGKLGE